MEKTHFTNYDFFKKEQRLLNDLFLADSSHLSVEIFGFPLAGVIKLPTSICWWDRRMQIFKEF